MLYAGTMSTLIQRAACSKLPPSVHTNKAFLCCVHLQQIPQEPVQAYGTPAPYSYAAVSSGIDLNHVDKHQAIMKQTKTVLSYPVYMVDFAVYKPDDELRINLNECADSCWKWKHPGTKAAVIYTCYLSSRGSSRRTNPQQLCSARFS